MSQASLPSSMYGAVDLSSLAAPTSRPAPTGPVVDGPGPSGLVPAAVMDVTEATFQDLVELSVKVPIVIDLWATWCEPCKTLTPALESLAAEFAGAIAVAKIDVDANPQIAAAFQVQSVPTVIAVIAGRPVPLFQGAVPKDQIRQVFNELLHMAAEAGVTGTVPVGELPVETDEEVDVELPPLHQAAFDAIDRGDFAAAESAYRQALRENPRDEFAEAGLAQVGLLARTDGVDPQVVIAAADATPTDVDAALLAADIEVLGGDVDHGLDRLVRLLKAVSGPEREQVRQRLVELFAVVGSDDPRVVTARRAMTAALF